MFSFMRARNSLRSPILLPLPAPTTHQPTLLTKNNVFVVKIKSMQYYFCRSQVQIHEDLLKYNNEVQILCYSPSVVKKQLEQQLPDQRQGCETQHSPRRRLYEFPPLKFPIKSVWFAQKQPLNVWKPRLEDHNIHVEKSCEFSPLYGTLQTNMNTRLL